MYQKPHKEKDSLCELLLSGMGKIRCRISAKPPQIFQPLEIKLSYRNGFYSSSDFRYIGAPIISSHNAILTGMYVNELLAKAGDYYIDHSQLFSSYVTTLAYLEQDVEIVASLRQFEQILLMSLGHGIDYSRTTGNAAIDRNKRYHFVVEQGFMESAQGRYSGDVIQAVANKAYSAKGVLSVARECQQLAIDGLLGEEVIHSRTWPSLSKLNS